MTLTKAQREQLVALQKSESADQRPGPDHVLTFKEQRDLLEDKIAEEFRKLETAEKRLAAVKASTANAQSKESEDVHHHVTKIRSGLKKAADALDALTTAEKAATGTSPIARTENE